MMDESEPKEVSQNPDFSTDTLRNIQGKIADCLEELSNSDSVVKQDNEKSYSSMFPGDNPTLSDINNVVKTNVEDTDVFLETVLSTSVTDEEVSSDCNYNTSSQLNILKRYKEEDSDTEVLQGEPPRKFPGLIDIYRTVGDNFDFNAESSTNSTNFCPRFSEVTEVPILTGPNSNRTGFALKSSNNIKTDSKDTLPDSNSNTVKVSKSSESGSESFDSIFNLTNSESEISHSDLEFSDSDRESKSDNLTPHDSSVAKELPYDTDDEYDCIQALKNSDDPERTLQLILYGSNSISDTRRTPEIDKGISVGSHETLRNAESTNSLNSDEEFDRIEALVNSEDPETALKNYSSVSNSVPLNASKISNNDSETLNFDSKISDRESEVSHPKLKFSGGEEESLPEERSFGIFKASEEHLDQIRAASKFHGFFETNNTIRVEKVTKMEQNVWYDRKPFVSSQERMKNKMLAASMNAGNANDSPNAFSHSDNPKIDFHKFLRDRNPFRRAFENFTNNVERTVIPVAAIKNMNTGNTCDPPKAAMSSNDPNAALDNFGFGINPSRNAPLKFNTVQESHQPNRQSSTLNQPKNIVNNEAVRVLQKERRKRKFEELSLGHSDSDNHRENFISVVETKVSSLDELVDIFKRVIRCHPINKLEIPPYESDNTERSSGKAGSKALHPCMKHEWGGMQLYSKKEHENILESHCDIDSHSVMVFDVTDLFSQNSSIICGTLIKEYMNISAKVNLVLIKKIQGISTEEYESRMCSLLALDDDLGYISAKLITTANDWIKQYHEIAECNSQPLTVSRDLNHMGILRICVLLVQILIKFSLEKQLLLENYENDLIYHRKRRS